MSGSVVSIRIPQTVPSRATTFRPASTLPAPGKAWMEGPRGQAIEYAEVLDESWIFIIKLEESSKLAEHVMRERPSMDKCESNGSSGGLDPDTGDRGMLIS